MDIDTDVLNDYVKTLETQLENKTVFLKQSQDSLRKLRREFKDRKDANPAAVSVDKETWKSFMKKPMMFVEKSDPIGLSLADSSIHMRNETSRDWIELMAGDQLGNKQGLETMIQSQRSVNADLEVLIDLLQHGDGDGAVDSNKISVSSTLSDKNAELWTSLNKLSSEVLCRSNEDAVLVESTLKRLVQYDPLLSVSDFNGTPELERLYRLLLRANVLDPDYSPSGLGHVRLVDFNDEDLS